MTVVEDGPPVPLSRSQQNIYTGVLQDSDPALYLVGRTYRFHRLDLAALLAALDATIRDNPIQLCVLHPGPAGGDFPQFVPRLRVRDLVQVASDGAGRGGEDLQQRWTGGLLGRPLVRYTVLTDDGGGVVGLDIHTHHLLLDGGATGIIEADLARHLAAGPTAENPDVGAGLARLAAAHRCEHARVERARERLADAVRRELAEDAHRGGAGRAAPAVPGAAARGVRRQSVRIAGAPYRALRAFADEQQIPINMLLATAAVAVDASIRQHTDGLLIHAVDNRFGESDLQVATCLVNSVAHPVRFAPFASVEQVARSLDRAYVRAGRRRWLREEQYRRMYLAIHRAIQVEALTFNFLPEPCAPGLRRHLSETPVTTDIGPVESTTVAGILDEQAGTLTVDIWDRADLSAAAAPSTVGERIAAVLNALPAMWDQPIAMLVDEWFPVAADGTCGPGDLAADPPAAPAWFVDPGSRLRQWRAQRRYIDGWLGWLVQNGVAPGDVVVLTDDDTDKTVDLLIACHLAGCAYSACDTGDQVGPRVNLLADQGITAHVVDPAAVAPADPDAGLRRRIDRRVDQVARDVDLASRTAYLMPTSGTTGEPKLVRVTHRSLAFFCAAIPGSYGWGPGDRILQCAPLTSDISVEEIFGAAFTGSELIRSTAMRAGDLPALAHDLATRQPTLVDLPTAVWQLICDDDELLDVIGGSRLRQVVIGGEAVRSSAVDRWAAAPAVQQISVISSYGPTETTVVVSYLPLVGDGAAVTSGARARLGRPIAANTVVVAFGEVVVVGETVSAGYLGLDDGGFGVVATPDGHRRRAFATGDRVVVDRDGFPVLSGRKDAVVKVSGKRVDTAEIARRVGEDPAVSDCAVELHDGGLGVWFQTRKTHADSEDPAAAARIRGILTGLRVPSFIVAGVPAIPRKPSGKVDSDRLRTLPRFTAAVQDGNAAGRDAAVGLADLWSRRLGTAVHPDSSLLDLGIGSLDLIAILPDTRRYLRRQLSILDLISADTAARLVAAGAHTEGWIDADTAAAIEADLAALPTRRSTTGERRTAVGGDARPVLVLGASGIVGTGFAQAAPEFTGRGPTVLLAARTPGGPRWVDLPARFGPAELADLIRDTGAGTVINCIGNTNVVVPYRDLRPANVDLVAAMTDACRAGDAKLVHLSTYVVNADVTAPRVTDPRQAPYPYAASKSLAELIVAGSPADLDFTIVRLPRVLGDTHQIRASADILASIVDACCALRAYPSVALVEEVTTARAAAREILGLLPEFGGPDALGRAITVVRGVAVDYATFLGEFGGVRLDIAEWKRRLDRSGWAQTNPHRWSMIDAWVTLGRRLGGRSYAQYLADYPTLGLGIDGAAELATRPLPLRPLLEQGPNLAPVGVGGGELITGG